MEILLHIDDTYTQDVEPEQLQNAATTTLKLFSPNPPDNLSVAVSISTADAVQELNAQYRGVDKPTDVLSFENTPDPDFPDADPEMENHLGDIIIAYPIAKTQATAAGHSTMAELTLLVVHGTLHLLGYDHDTLTNKERMWLAQQQAMTQLGLADIQPTED